MNENIEITGQEESQDRRIENAVSKEVCVVSEITKLHEVSEALSKTKFFVNKNMGYQDVFLILMKAKLLGIPEFDALNGDLYAVKGKVEMTSQSMNLLIRQAGHSILKDSKSDNEQCTLQGTRKDTGDTMTTTFTIADAKKAGIYKGAWIGYPQAMLFARALSMLARQLFPDVIRGCYVQGEISGDDLITADFEEMKETEIVEDTTDCISEEQIAEIVNLTNGYDHIKDRILAQYEKIDLIHKDLFDGTIATIKTLISDTKKAKK